MSRSFASSPSKAIGVTAILLLCGIIWALSHVYQGLFHDANLYTLQALGWLGPDSLSHDVFLRLGSQDRYTIFSPIFAFAIQLLGPEWAAASLTLASQIAFFVGAWIVARDHSRGSGRVRARLAVGSADPIGSAKLRAGATASVVSPQPFLSCKNAGVGLVLSVQQLQHACRLAVFPYLVTGADIGMTPIGVVSGRSGRPFDAQRLYRCANQSS